MGRMYVIEFDSVAVTAAQDLFEVVTNDDKVLVLHELSITQESDAGDAESEQLSFSLSRASGTYTSGSGGSTPTEQPLDAGDAAGSITCEANNTTRASAGTGSLTKLFERAENIHAGFHYLPTPECRPVVSGGAAFIVGLESTPVDSLTMNGYMIVEEIG